MPLLRKKSNVAIHFYKTGAVRLLQKTKVKAKSGRGRPKSVRQIVLLDTEDVNALAAIVREAQKKAAIAADKAKVQAEVRAQKKAEKAQKALLVAPKIVEAAPAEPQTIVAPAVESFAPEITNADVETEPVAP